MANKKNNSRFSSLNLLNVFFTFAIVALIVAVMVLQYYPFTPSGDVVVYTAPQGSAAQKASCKALFEGVELNLDSFNSGKKSAAACENVSNSLKGKIMDQMCVNSATLGEVEIYFDSNKIKSIPIECPQELADDDVAITMSGEYLLAHMDFFDQNKTKFISSLQEPKSGKRYTLKIANKDDQIEGVHPGDTIKVRGKLSGNSINLLTGDEKSVEKLSSGAD